MFVAARGGLDETGVYAGPRYSPGRRDLGVTWRAAGEDVPKP